MENSTRWQRAELLIFTTVTLVNLLPFLATRFFPSMDGPSHLCNSNIINQLVFYHNSLFHQFFTINPEPVPNWTSHLLVSLLMLVMPAFVAEKILILVILTGIPFAFRTLMQTISPRQTLYSFLIFPFTHSMFFFFGFYNFCLAVLFFLVTLNYWLRHEHIPWNPKRIFTFVLLVTSAYFSHIVIFGLLVILIILHMATGFIAGMVAREARFKTMILLLWKKVVIVTLASIVPFMLFIYFFYSRPGTRVISYIARKDLISYLVTVRPVISFNIIDESRFTKYLFYLVILMVAIGLGAFLTRLARSLFSKPAEPQGLPERLLPRSSFWWLLVSAGLMLLLFFTLPDGYGTASYTSLRVAFIFYLTLFLLISTFRLPWWVGLLALFIGVSADLALLRYYRPKIMDLSSLAMSVNKTAEHVAPNSTVLPVDGLEEWYTGHFADFLAVDKPIVMIKNYECVSGYFPVIWNKDTRPDCFLGSPATPRRYMNFGVTKGHPYIPVDYVLVIGQYDPARDWFCTLHRILTNDFLLVYSNDHCRLFKNKAPRIPLVLPG